MARHEREGFFRTLFRGVDSPFRTIAFLSIGLFAVFVLNGRNGAGDGSASLAEPVRNISPAPVSPRDPAARPEEGTGRAAVEVACRGLAPASVTGASSCGGTVAVVFVPDGNAENFGDRVASRFPRIVARIGGGAGAAAAAAAAESAAADGGRVFVVVPEDARVPELRRKLDGRPGIRLVSSAVPSGGLGGG